VSETNVEKVLRVIPAPDVDIIPLVRDDNKWAAWAEAIAPSYHADCEVRFPTLPGNAGTYVGLDGLRAVWLDWTAPWTTYRAEVVEAIDCGDRVLLVAPTFGRLPGSTHEVKIDGANVWTVRDDKIARVEFYLTRAEALKAVGLSE
jgi:ketosteroid isomerase-like protein